MPTIILHRVWCKECNEFTLHSGGSSDLKCDTCGTKYTDVYLKDIPEDKLINQQERWKESNVKTVRDLFSSILITSPNILSEDTPVEIIESDAGLKQSRKEEREKREAKLAELKAIKAKYKDAKRNDLCICGSGIKYKKCCWDKISKITV